MPTPSAPTPSPQDMDRLRERQRVARCLAQRRCVIVRCSGTLTTGPAFHFQCDREPTHLFRKEDLFNLRVRPVTLGST